MTSRLDHAEVNDDGGFLVPEEHAEALIAAFEESRLSFATATYVDWATGPWPCWEYEIFPECCRVHSEPRIDTLCCEVLADASGERFQV